MKHMVGWIMVIGLAFGGAHQAMAQIPVQDNDSQILGILTAIDENEIQIARLAEDKNIDGPIINYAWTLQIEHQRNLNRIRWLAGQLGIRAANYDISARVLRTNGIGNVQILSALDKDNFSREFLWDLVEDYSNALTWINSQDAHNVRLQHFLDETGRYIALHLQRAQSIQENVLR